MSEICKNFKRIIFLKGLVRFFGFFIFAFLVVFIGFNSESIWSQLKYTFFQEQVFVSEQEAMEILKEKTNEEQSKEQFEDFDRIFIEKIGVAAPIIKLGGDSQKDILISLKKGVVLYPESTVPGEKGAAVILGHSSPHFRYRGEYNSVFSLLNKLEQGDEIFVYYQKTRYVYKVSDKFIFAAAEENKFLPNREESRSLLVLLSCWPVGTDWKRIAIIGELVM